MKIVPALSVLATVAIGVTAWSLLGGSGDGQAAVPRTLPRSAESPASADPIQAARRTCDPHALDAVVADLVARTQAVPGEARTFHALAEACLERALLRSHRRGMVVGEPTWSTLPQAIADDVDRGLAAIGKARELGERAASLWRLEASLLSQRITGLTTAMQWNDRIQAALKKATELAGDDPQLHVALGLRKLLAPKLFGHDAGKALEHFDYAAKALGDDERPAVFARMATWLQQKRTVATGWLEQAVARNPRNEFARVVLRRLRAGEADPFGRDVTAEEAAAAAR